MTATDTLLQIDPHAALLLLEGEPRKVGHPHPTLGQAVLDWSAAGMRVRTVRGRKARTLDGLFDEVAAALQFAYYFGENWDAFSECLSEMDDLSPDSGLVVVVNEPEQVLDSAHEADLRVLVEIIQSAAETYAQPIQLGQWWDRPAIPFHVVLMPLPAAAALTRSRWTAASARITELDR